MKNFWFLFPLFALGILHWNGTNYVAATVTYAASSATADSAYFKLTDTAYTTKFNKGDSLQILMKYQTYGPVSLNFFYTAGDTLTDSIAVYQQNKILAYFSRPAKGTTQYNLNYTNVAMYPNSEKLTFTTIRRKVSGAKVASLDRFQFNQFTQ